MIVASTHAAPPFVKKDGSTLNPKPQTPNPKPLLENDGSIF
jgi:hypothetical protein